MALPLYNRPKRKKHYAVYHCMQGIGVYHHDKIRTFAGETWAVSAKQACNNVKFRNEGKASNFYSVEDYADEGEHFYWYEADEI